MIRTQTSILRENRKRNPIRIELFHDARSSCHTCAQADTQSLSLGLRVERSDRVSRPRTETEPTRSLIRGHSATGQKILLVHARFSQVSAVMIHKIYNQTTTYEGIDVRKCVANINQSPEATKHTQTHIKVRNIHKQTPKLSSSFTIQ